MKRGEPPAAAQTADFVEPTSVTVQLSALAASAAAHETRDRDDLAGELGELRRRDLLRGVAERLLGARVRLDDDPVGTDRDGCPGERQDEVAPAGGVRGIDDHRQVRLVLEHRDRA